MYPEGVADDVFAQTERTERQMDGQTTWKHYSSGNGHRRRRCINITLRASHRKTMDDFFLLAKLLYKGKSVTFKSWPNDQSANQ